MRRGSREWRLALALLCAPVVGVTLGAVERVEPGGQLRASGDDRGVCPLLPAAPAMTNASHRVWPAEPCPRGPTRRRRAQLHGL